MSVTSKERVLTALRRQEPDRVPINYKANPEIDRRLKEHYGLEAGDRDGLAEALGVDFRHVFPPYVGPALHKDSPERGIRVDHWGIHRRWIEHETGGYWDFCDFPLSDATEEEVAAWPMPSPDDFDFENIAAECRNYAPYAVSTGGAGIGDIINGNGMLRGMEQTLVDLVTNDPAGLLLARRRIDINLEIMRRTLKAAEGGVDLLWIGEDLGTQIAPIISLELYRKHIRPLHQKFVDLARAHDLPIMIHTCGSSSWAYEDFVEMGIDAVDTLQPEAADMAPEHLKRAFGGRLAFHGCISTAGPLTFGTAEDAVNDARHILDIMMPGGGYCFAPTHQIQDNTPTENVVAVYETAREYGTYA